MPIPSTASRSMNCSRPTRSASSRSATCCSATSTHTRPRPRPKSPSRTPCFAAAAQAKADDLEHHVFRVNYADIDSARIDGRPEGFAKVVASPSGKILGATILGVQASLVLQQLVLAMDAGLGLGELAETTQIYPTYGQVIRELAGQFQATRQRGFMATALRFFYGFQPRTAAVDG